MRDGVGMSEKEKILLRVGEATVGKGVTAAEPEVIIGEVSGPVGYAFANLLGGQVYGHTRLLALLNINWMIRPPTIMVSKVTMKNTDYINLFCGPVQAATAKAVVDCVEEETIPKNKVDDLVIIDSVWLNPNATADDIDELYKSNYEATKLAVERAMVYKPTIDELLKKKDVVKHIVIDRIRPKP